MNKRNSNNSVSGEIGFTGLLTIAFIVLKLLNVIEWSWWWVLSPIWISVALVIFCLMTMVIVSIVLTAQEDKKKNKK